MAHGLHVGLGRLNGHIFGLLFLNDERGIFVEVVLEEPALDLLFAVLAISNGDDFEVGEEVELAFL